MVPQATGKDSDDGSNGIEVAATTATYKLRVVMVATAAAPTKDLMAVAANWHSCLELSSFNSRR